MENPATSRDLADRDYSGPASETAQQVRLDEAWRALQLESPGIAARVEAGELPPEAVVDIVCAATLRVLRNPDGHESGAAAIDDYTESWKLRDATEDLYFTAAELRRLAPAYSSAAFIGSMKYL
ncbi:hypothetical protein [Nocardioides sp. LHG3406-4]|uniref:hypothetical protein n=1 Tax=Nocardioides sp. LHG3406-4 TaxID=2804575 RepID=UPI003CFA1035